MARPYKDWDDFVAHFWARVDRLGDDECWLWQGAPTTKGYGVTCFRGKKVYAHRAAWEIENGRPIPDGLCGLHSCDTPLCCNPSHVFLGTQTENMADVDRKGRRRTGRARGEAHGRCKYSDAQVAGARALYARGGISQRAAGRAFGISKGYVTRLLRGDFR